MVGANKFQRRGIEAIVSMIESNSILIQLYLCNDYSENVAENEVENEEAEMIARALEKNLSIVELDVSGNFSETVVGDINRFCKRNIEKQLISA